ncbi:hypothetical protein [Turneriella parva]|uniref:Uncharacterized protein n=1 Tax=Turneriella parva (strain ATCC BAA-1111 / DSM 21527 / NCTC 11395 / H) TaxID=869212 RepID=I4B1U8_TURPD|nr:hypothetical protein [Turneriella parva]AFM11255.1 hypothetical protein Turpa_0603 [Turneriella parva DSM 21527]
MKATNRELPQAIIEAAEKTLHAKDRLVVRAYGFIPVTEYFMRDFIKKILAKFNRPELAPAIGMIIKELTVNAAKANFKRILFIENNIDVENPADFERGMKIFREAISESMALEYGKKAKNARLNVHATFDFDENRLIVEIRNNLPMSRIEEERVREKFAQAMRCNDIAEFMMENVDETEGAGLGLILSLMALKSSQIDPHVLTISTNYESETIARVEIPFNEKYQPRRARAHDSAVA